MIETSSDDLLLASRYYSDLTELESCLCRDFVRACIRTYGRPSENGSAGTNFRTGRAVFK